jgi:hypothetical protein
MIKYVLYSLDWRFGEGQQPHEQVEKSGSALEPVSFKGGVAVIDGRYLGYIFGTDEQISAAVFGCGKFGMEVISQIQALQFYEKYLPTNTVDPSSNEYIGPPVVQPDGTFLRETSTAEYPVPTFVDYSISPERVEIAADGVDSIDFVIVADPNDATVNVLLSGVVQPVELTDGVGTVTVKSDIPGLIIIQGESGALHECIGRAICLEVV